MIRKWWLINKLRKENYNLRFENTKLSKDNFKYSKTKVFRCDYNNLLHENAVLVSRGITYSEKIEELKKQLEDSIKLTIDQHLKIKELNHFINNMID